MVPNNANAPILQLPENSPIVLPEYNLSNEQWAAVDSLNAQIPNLIASLDGPPTPDEVRILYKWADKTTARRYLTDCKWKLDAAASKLKSTLQWRLHYKPHAIKLSDIEAEAKFGKMFNSGFDKTGRPILFVIPRLDHAKNPDAALKFLVWSVENTIKIMPPGIEKMSVCVDWEGLGMFNAPPIAVARKYLDTLQTHYPERLGVFCLINPSIIVTGLFNMLKPAMDPITIAKVHLVTVSRKRNSPHNNNSSISGSISNWYHSSPIISDSASSDSSVEQSPKSSNTNISKEFSILEIISADMLPTEFGGGFNFKYEHQVYLRSISSI
ncbi:hypothetical protein HK100_008504 [Physocladia obscura]|uniref:CRAL-TRIO domain-containing protein n=1 Tax=Physocladia obscura TaxID=109957 RepID=A0AAD5T5T0_9FUNG|nr:hypothetical protein HK100_008504 [Physocladia obscura]